MKHLGFLYYSICYLIGLPSLAVAVIARLRTRSETLKRAIPFLAAVTLQLALSAVNQYMEINVAGRVTPARLVILYAYFLAEAATILVLPRIAHHLAQVSWARIGDRIFTALALAMMVLLLTPFALRYGAAEEVLRSRAGLYFYRAVLVATVVYAVSLVLARLPKVRDKLTRVLIWLALAFFAVWLLGFLHCKLMPLFQHIPGDLPLAPVGFFIWNSLFILGVARRHLIAPAGDGVPLAELCARRGLTERETEVTRLLLAGQNNREIAARLYISESTVKTHVLNIYRKLGLKNRVQLANLFAAREKDPPAAR